MSTRPPYTGWKLYLLCEPKAVDPEEEPRYVGISKNTARRYREHLSGKRSTKAVRAWIRRLKRQGLRPAMKVYHFEGSLEAMRRQEVSVIRQLRRQNCQLLNCQHNTAPRHWPHSRRLPQGRTLGLPGLKKKLGGTVLRR